MNITSDAKYIRVPNNTNGICKQLFIYIEGVLEKILFITPDNKEGYTYYPLYNYKDQKITIQTSDDSLLDELAIIV